MREGSCIGGATMLQPWTLSSLLSELQVMIPKVNHNGVCICIVWVVFGLWTLEYLSGYKLRVRQDKCTNSKFLVNYQGRGSAWNR